MTDFPHAYHLFRATFATIPDMDASAIESLYLTLLSRWNSRDAAGMAALYADDGSQVGFDGSAIDGRMAIETHLAPIFRDHPTGAFVGIVREVRDLGPGTALLRAVAGMVPAGKEDIDPDLNAIQTLVAVQRGGEWKVAMFHNTPAAFHGKPEEAAALTEELRARVKAG